MSDLTNLIKVKDAAEDDLLKIPGVTGVAMGNREKGGTRTDEIVIHVYVEKKRALKDVPARERIPAEIRGYKTDVIERPSDVHTTSVENHPARPVASGLHITVYPVWAGGRGTICCFVRPKGESANTKRLFLLTAAHVMNPNYKENQSQQEGRIVCQPAQAIFINRQVAETRKYVYGGSVDAGICRLICPPAHFFASGGVAYSNYVWRIGPVTETGIASKGQRVRKHGATTGLTCGEVYSTNASRKFPQTGVTLRDLFTINWVAEGSDTKTFCEGGDSGAPIIDSERRLVGILIGKSGSNGSACHIGNVFDALGVELASLKGNSGWPPVA